MNHAERLEELQILMPGTSDQILQFLASDHTIVPWENSHEERNLYADRSVISSTSSESIRPSCSAS